MTSASTRSTHSSPDPRPLADVFCRVIDNLGDIGVCWRLSAVLAAQGWRVRLWADDLSALQWMAPDGPGRAHIELCEWQSASDPKRLAQLAPAQLWVEAFGCELPEAFVAHAVRTRSSPPEWVNLEYLSAEDWVLRMNGLPSPVLSGPAKGWTKRFVFPGFKPGTGGLLREADLLERQARFDADDWLRSLGLPLQAQALRLSLFCYEPPFLAAWLDQLTHPGHPTIDVLITPGRAQRAWTDACKHLGWASPPPGLRAHPLPWLSQIEFDHLLWSCDLNLVRGEDSLVRALWAGKPLLWQLYPQDDAAHHTKLEAFLHTLNAPPAWADLHRLWNGAQPVDASRRQLNQWLSADSMQAAGNAVRRLRDSTLNLPPLQASVIATTR